MMTRLGMQAFAAALVLSLACGGGSSHSTPPAQPPPQQPQQPPPQPQAPAAVPFGTQGPWAVANTVYGWDDGIEEPTVVAMTTDEAQDRWVATPRALYLLRPGDKRFTRFDETAGLHLGDVTGRTPGPVGWAKYCDGRPIASDAPCNTLMLWGGASAEGIRSLVGGAPGEVFVGYAGAHTDGTVCKDQDDPTGDAGYDYCDPLRHSGKIDHVRLNADGTLEVHRFDLLSNLIGGKYWHDRYMNRLVYDHFVHPGTLYSGSEHGVTILFPDRWRAPRPDEWFDLAYSEYMGDHLHAQVCRNTDGRPCQGEGAGQRMGDWLGLAIDDQGRLWHAGKWSAGRITWNSDPHTWVDRNGAAFDAAFGDPYAPGGVGTPPVFEVAEEGHEARMTGAAWCSDGRTWFTTKGAEDGPSAARGDAVAVWDGRRFQYFTGPAVGIPEAGVRDVACLPDGRLVFAGFTTGLSVYDPVSRTSTPIRAWGGLIPSDGIRSIEVDRMVNPPTLHVATDAGAAALRQLP
jgi:hypothetical protein